MRTVESWRAGPPGYPRTRTGRHSGPSPPPGDSPIGTSIVVGVTLPSAHAGNESVTLARPLPASSGTRTGPWKTLPQQNRSST
jgi:hypothetical protein